MSDTLTPEQRLRAFFRSRDDHDRLCMTRAPKSTPDHLRECDCYAKPDVVAHELIDEIEAENATLRAELATWKHRAGNKWSQHDLDQAKKIGKLTNDLFAAYAERDAALAEVARLRNLNGKAQ